MGNHVHSEAHILIAAFFFFLNVILGTADNETRDQFLEEIELMKTIGSHRNVVGMLGCWVNSDPIFLLLEYVPYGDLQHWLRNKRIQVGLIMARNIGNGSVQLQLLSKEYLTVQKKAI